MIIIIMNRLKVDILREISSSLHLLLHEETENGGLDPCYIAVSPHDVNTLAGNYTMYNIKFIDILFNI